MPIFSVYFRCVYFQLHLIIIWLSFYAQRVIKHSLLQPSWDMLSLLNSSHDSQAAEQCVCMETFWSSLKAGITHIPRRKHVFQWQLEIPGISPVIQFQCRKCSRSTGIAKKIWLPHEQADRLKLFSPRLPDLFHRSFTPHNFQNGKPNSQQNGFTRKKQWNFLSLTFSTLFLLNQSSTQAAGSSMLQNYSKTKTISWQKQNLQPSYFLQFGLIKCLPNPSLQTSAPILNISCRKLSQFDMLNSIKAIFLCVQVLIPKRNMILHLNLSLEECFYSLFIWNLFKSHLSLNKTSSCVAYRTNCCSSSA